MVAMLYLDTSALLKLYVKEEGSEAVQRRVAAQDFPLPVWEIQEAELINGLRLKAFWKEIPRAKAEEQIARFYERRRQGYYVVPQISRSDLMEQFRELSALTPRLGCRTLDILHVACALQLGVGEFLTFDRRQAQLAGRAGLRVPAPA